MKLQTMSSPAGRHPSLVSGAADSMSLEILKATAQRSREFGLFETSPPPVRNPAVKRRDDLSVTAFPDWATSSPLGILGILGPEAIFVYLFQISLSLFNISSPVASCLSKLRLSPKMMNKHNTIVIIIRS